MPSFVFIAVGPCTLISDDFCNYCDSFFCGTIVQSTIVQCISFWYRWARRKCSLLTIWFRLRILSKPPPSGLILNLIVFVSGLPNIAHVVFSISDWRLKKYDISMSDLFQIYESLWSCFAQSSTDAVSSNELDQPSPLWWVRHTSLNGFILFRAF